MSMSEVMYDLQNKSIAKTHTSRNYCSTVIFFYNRRPLPCPVPCKLIPEEVLCYRRVSYQSRLIELLGRPVHNGVVHAVLGGQHAHHRVPMQGQHALHQAHPQTLCCSSKDGQVILYFIIMPVMSVFTLYQLLINIISIEAHLITRGPQGPTSLT